MEENGVGTLTALAESEAGRRLPRISGPFDRLGTQARLQLASRGGLRIEIVA